MYNLVLLRPDTVSEESWFVEADPKEIRAIYEGWSPMVTKLTSVIEKGVKSRLVVRDSLQTWLHPNGRVTFIGKACHPLLPYVAQGPGMAIEDAAVLGALFNGITSRSQTSNLLKAYESLRIPRTADIQLAARSNRRAFHPPDGPEQRVRDEAMRKFMYQAQGSMRSDGGGNAEENGDRIEAKVLYFLYSYDPDRVVKEWYLAEGYRIYQETVKL